jgi:hypothetical protein
MTNGKSGCGARSRKVIVGGLDRGQPQPAGGLVLVRPGVGVVRVVEQLDHAGGAADDDVRGERALDAVLDVARSDRRAGLEAETLAERERPGGAAVRRGAEVRGEVGHQLAGAAGLGGVADQRAGVEPHEVPHAGEVGALRVEVVDLAGHHPQRAAGGLGRRPDAGDAGVRAAAEDGERGAVLTGVGAADRHSDHQQDDGGDAGHPAAGAPRPGGAPLQRAVHPTRSPPVRRRRSAAVGGCPTDLRELVGVQAGATDECTVDIRPGQDPGRVRGLHRPAVEDTDDPGGLGAETLGEPWP